MRANPRSVAVVAVAAIGVLALLLFGPEEGEPQEAPPSEAAVPAAAEPAGEDAFEEPSPSEAEGVPDEVLEFIDSYADPHASDEAWGRALEPNVTPALHASLIPSDRELAQAAGNEVLEASEGRVSVGTSGGVSYSLEYTLLEGEHEHDGTEGSSHPIVTGIDFTAAPDGARLPLETDGAEQVRAPVQQALTAVVAQPGGQSDEDRERLIRDTFTRPENAVSMPRSVDDGSAVRIGNVHELVLAAEADQLVAYATVPYARDGESTPTWVTVTVELTRDDAGAWTPQDAHL